MRRCLFLFALFTAAVSVAEEPLTFSTPLGAHRGGKGEWPESTTHAYEKAAALWPDILLESDLHLSADGVPVVMHDKTLDRTTDGTGPIGAKTLAELKELDAAYKFSTDKGATFPLRGQGVRIPTFAEALNSAPNHRFLVEFKDGIAIVDAAIAVIRELKAEDRVIIASFNPIFMKQLREKAPEIRTCFDTQTAMQLVLALRGPAWDAYTPVDDVLSFSPGLEKTMALKPEEMAAIQKKGIALQVHTLNTEEEMRKYLDIKVDSILTDYPSRLAALLGK